jgi:hypothetical protein
LYRHLVFHRIAALVGIRIHRFHSQAD